MDVQIARNSWTASHRSGRVDLPAPSKAAAGHFIPTSRPPRYARPRSPKPHAEDCARRKEILPPFFGPSERIHDITAAAAGGYYVTTKSNTDGMEKLTAAPPTTSHKRLDLLQSCAFDMLFPTAKTWKGSRPRLRSKSSTRQLAPLLEVNAGSRDFIDHPPARPTAATPTLDRETTEPLAPNTFPISRYRQNPKNPAAISATRSPLADRAKPSPETFFGPP